MPGEEAQYKGGWAVKEFQIVRYVSNWKYLIALCTVLGGIVFYGYFSRQQVYTAYAIISYTNADAKSGKTPSGTDIDVSEIYSPNVVADAIEKLESNVSVDFVRSRIKVEPIISDEEQKRKEAILKEGEEYEESPTDYYISFSVGKDYSEDFAKNMLNTVLSSYFDFYSEKYVAKAVIPNNVENIGKGNYDYIESIDIMKQSIGEILEYLNSNQAGFRSSRTGYSFYDLITSYQLLEEISLDRLYVDVLSGRKTRDRTVLIEKTNNEIQSLQIQLEKMKAQSDELLLTIAQYNPKILEAQEYSTDTKDAKTANSIILQDIYDRKDGEGNIVYSENTYDTLISHYVDYNKEIFRLEQQIEEKQYILARFQDNTGPSVSLSDEILKERIRLVADRMDSLYKIVAQTGREYNSYLVSKNIAMQNSVDAYAHLNLKLYMTMAFVLFFGIGCCGAILIGRIGDIVEYTLYVDRKTRLPSRLSCDERIEKIKKRGALGTFTCVVLSVENLKEVNRTIGYAAGDKVLEEIGTILKTLSKEYGFIGYNGANQFLCLLDNCTYGKAEFMVSLLSEAVKQFNDGNPGVMIEMKARIADSKKTGIYQINKLISKAYEMEGIIIG